MKRMSILEFVLRAISAGLFGVVWSWTP